MSADPPFGPTASTAQDPADLLTLLEKASEEPTRPEYVEGLILVPPQPDDHHNEGAYELSFQLRAAGFDLTGIGNGYRAAYRSGRTLALVIPDFYVRRRRPSDLDEAYRKAHKGWYPADMLALAGEITSSNHETDTGPKLRAYAAVGVPVYVLIHRGKREVYVYSEPVPLGELSDTVDHARELDALADCHYRSVATTELGGKLRLPDPYPVLDTSFPRR